MIKGIVAAGGLGTRLDPLTQVTNKALLPVYDRPMIFHPIQTLVESGITDILLVCGGNAAGEFLRILGNGEYFGLKHLHYTYQSEPRGIADALGLAKEWAKDEPIALILADNIYENSFEKEVMEFSENPCGARIFTTETEFPQWYGVVEVDENNNVKTIEEKPKQPKSNLIATGLYLYDQKVWEYIKRCKPSGRGELEITDVNGFYLQDNALRHHKVNGWWADAGENIDTYVESGVKMKKIKSERLH